MGGYEQTGEKNKTHSSERNKMREDEKNHHAMMIVLFAVLPKKKYKEKNRITIDFELLFLLLSTICRGMPDDVLWVGDSVTNRHLVLKDIVVISSRVVASCLCTSFLPLSNRCSSSNSSSSNCLHLLLQLPLSYLTLPRTDTWRGWPVPAHVCGRKKDSFGQCLSVTKEEKGTFDKE